MLDLYNVILILGSRTELAKTVNLHKALITRWNDFGYIPDQYTVVVKKALRARKKVLDKAYEQAMKG